MSWTPPLLQRVLSQVLGDPLHRERCIWVGDDGNHCQNTVPLGCRINGVLCFQLLQNPPFAYLPVQEFSSAAKRLFCLECRRHRCRSKVWATRFLRQLDQAKDVTVHSEPHDSALLVHQWPTSMSHNVATAVFPNESFSKPEEVAWQRSQLATNP
ncbi:unnamed protein product [Penicillium nalgiovense]|uniref:Uncharacterized protein n=1 Tax=Penicillium nalgiovense TaxID=60175 RepID=A0A9W4HWU5_PENNA|nr:unnamed protein product [Penicillium nalgiovense]CAG8102451.1 unnamed protein product [Penicillium nalgiovense]CAG8119566.1 unnamed protein product [Penicillium nalgiovense]CAG8123639.1 unnamed protein product [Penicillium nalgiovense]CAG8127270.1 unnamed protein product [Penicillium nalgiovense]